jgi:hypothetical protein
MRNLTSMTLAGLLLAPNAFARDVSDVRNPLPSGKPAGVIAAQGAPVSTAVLIGLGAGLTGLAIALIASGGKAGGCASNNPNTPCGSTSTSTSTSP